MTDPDDHSAIGMGRIGRLPSEITLETLARQIQSKLGLAAIKMTGHPEMLVQDVAVCSGSGSSLIDTFLASRAQVFVSGDLRYHDARKVEDARRALIDIGHFSSEHLIINPLVDRLNSEVKSRGWQVVVEPCPLECDPFIYLMDEKSASI